MLLKNAILGYFRVILGFVTKNVQKRCNTETIEISTFLGACNKKTAILVHYYFSICKL